MKALTTKIENASRALLCYLLMVAIALLAVVAIWNGWANGALYRCTDPGIIDLWPPFVHVGTNDMHAVPITLLNALWGCLVIAALLVPALVLWVLCRILGPDLDEQSI